MPRNELAVTKKRGRLKKLSISRKRDLTSYKKGGRDVFFPSQQRAVRRIKHDGERPKPI